MPAFLGQIGATVAGILVSMSAQLVTERFLKSLIVRALEAAARKSATDLDDKLVQDAKRAWGVD